MSDPLPTYYENSDCRHRSQIIKTHVQSPVAELAAELARSYGMIAGIQDGEDSQGRHKLRLLTADEVINRANTIAEGLFRTAGEKGWLVPLAKPVPEADAKEGAP